MFPASRRRVPGLFQRMGICAGMTLGLFVMPLWGAGHAEYRLIYDRSTPQLEFAASKLRDQLQSSLSTAERNGMISIEFKLSPGICVNGGFDIRVSKELGIQVLAPDANGLMYGGLELAEQISLYGEFQQKRVEPYLQKRGIKMNIPLDVRTPSYDDSGDAAQQNILEMWNWDFWEQYLDSMAMNRYNVLSLWNPHPFPSMIEMKDYPDVALEDVWKTTLKPCGVENEWAEPQLVSSNVVERAEVVKRISIEEKIAFWQKVMQRAHDRGIEIYFITWNVCPNGAAIPMKPYYRTYDVGPWDETPGKHGITHQMDNPITRAYYREAVKTFLLTYPHVKGIGVTAGEHMVDQAGDITREQWIWETYGLGILDAKALEPERKVDFIHRVWNTDMDKIMRYWNAYPDTFEASFKYAKARLYSTTKPPFAKAHLKAMQKYGLDSWWNLRNDDIFVFRWGDPDYVREFLLNFDNSQTAGFYMGSDGYVWGREFVSRQPELAGQLEFEKHWYKFLLWGRLAFQPDLDHEYFVKKIEERYPGICAERLYKAWKSASKIVPQVNCFHWRDWDYMWAVEGCLDMRDGFHNVLRFIDNPTLQGSDLLNPREYAQQIKKGGSVSGTTPLSVVSSLRQDAEDALEGISDLQVEHASVELRELLEDIEAFARIGQYYADKIEAACELAKFQEGFGEDCRDQAVILLIQAAEKWALYAGVADQNYRPQILARTRTLDWKAIQANVDADIELARNVSM